MRLLLLYSECTKDSTAYHLAGGIYLIDDNTESRKTKQQQQQKSKKQKTKADTDMAKLCVFHLWILVFSDFDS